MEQIEALERRIAAALGRIGTALAQPDARAEHAARLEAEWATAQAKAEAALAEVERLTQALEDEALVARQIRARNESLHEKLDAIEAETQILRNAAAEAEAKAERLRGELLVRDALTSQLRRVNLQLRQNNLALRDAVLKGMPDPNLVNKAMLTELESIRASRDAERAEIDAVLEELRVILETGGVIAAGDEAAGAGEAEASALAEPLRQDDTEAAEPKAETSQGSEEEASNA